MSGLNYIHNIKKLLEEDSLISYPLVKKEEKGGRSYSYDSSSLWPQRCERFLPVGSPVGGLIGITCDSRAFWLRGIPHVLCDMLAARWPGHSGSAAV